MDKLFNPTLYNGCNYLSMLGLKWIHVSKGKGVPVEDKYPSIIETEMTSFWRKKNCSSLSAAEVVNWHDFNNWRKFRQNEIFRFSDFNTIAADALSMYGN